MFVEAKPPMPEDMPEDLKAEYNAIDAEIEKLPKNERGHPDFSKIPDDLKTRMRNLRTNYESQTGHQWPRPPHGPPPGEAPSS